MRRGCEPRPERLLGTGGLTCLDADFRVSTGLAGCTEFNGVGSAEFCLTFSPAVIVTFEAARRGARWHLARGHAMAVQRMQILVLSEASCLARR
jgi:hypothetical protein